MKTYKMRINGQDYEARILKYDGVNARVNVNGVDFNVEIDNAELETTPRLVRTMKSPPGVSGLRSESSGVTPGQVKAPIPGQLVDIRVNPGDIVKSGDVLGVLEAMKMESEITAPTDGTVTAISVKKGESVTEGQVLFDIQPLQSTTPKHQQAVPPKPRHSPAAPPSQPVHQQPAPSAGSGHVTAPIPGTVYEIRVSPGQQVQPEDVVIVIEAMKMETEITTPVAGTVKQILVQKGESVHEGQTLVEISPS